MNTKGFIFSVILAVLSINVNVTFAQQRYQEVVCRDTKTVFEYLKNNYGEEITSVSDYRGGKVLIWQNYEKKTISVVYMSDDGKESCLVISGNNVIESDKSKKMKLTHV